MKPRIAVVGASGYVGAELIRWLLLHPKFELAAVVSQGSPGTPLDVVHPGLGGLTDLICEPFHPAALALMDAVILATPHGVSKDYVPQLEDVGVPRIFEMSSDHRTADGWVYGLAEWNRERLVGATRVAVPGCFATAILLAIAPLVAAKSLAGPVQVAAATGSTGSGAVPSAGTHHPERAVNFRAHKPLKHQHMAEMLHFLGSIGDAPELAFVPMSAPLDRGLFATVFARVRPGIDVEALFTATYKDDPMIRRRAESPELRHVRGTGSADLNVVQQGEQVVVLSAIDNIGKGAATQAIQCLNLAFSYPEATGLRLPPILP